MSRLTRRHFVKGTVTAGAVMAAASYSRVLGANDDIRLAVVGIRSRGHHHVKWFDGISGARVTALCDVDTRVLEREKEHLKKKSKDREVTTCVDYRKLLEDKNIDAVVSATPNHWHALVTVLACQAGKDVYIEKPVSHEIWEGRKMVEAAVKYKRIVQTGTQSRSDAGLREAFAYLQKGELGTILWARGFCYKRRGSIGKVNGPQPIPASVDYNLWCGPADMRPLMRKRLHYDWHWVWNTGNGDIGNQGIHQMDMARWALGQDGLAPRVMSIGGRFGYVDDANTPNTQIAFYDYKPAPLIFEVRGLPRGTDRKGMDNYRNTRVGVVVQCENGYFAGSAGGGKVYDNDGKQVRQFKGSGGGNHAENFIKAVRSRKPDDLNAPIEEGHLSSALCHMGNISCRLGRRTSPAEIGEAIKDNAELADSFERFKTHLAANGVDLEKTPAAIGPMLEMDPEKETFTGARAAMANMYLKRNYREPFVVPDEV